MAKTVRKVVKSKHDAFWSHILDFWRTTFFELAICMGLKTLLCSLNAIHRLRSWYKHFGGILYMVYRYCINRKKYKELRNTMYQLNMCMELYFSYECFLYLRLWQYKCFPFERKSEDIGDFRKLSSIPDHFSITRFNTWCFRRAWSTSSKQFVVQFWRKYSV